MRSLVRHDGIVILTVLLSYLASSCSKGTEPLENRPPLAPAINTHLGSPPEGSTGRSLAPVLSWACSDPDMDPLSYDVYFGTGSPPPLANADQSRNSYSPSILEPSTEYYWQIDAIDDGGNISSSAVMQFTTSDKPMVLVDASHGGGGWWFPQGGYSGFNPAEPHQGKALADFIRGEGFQVDELPRGATITDSLLNCYDKVIRAGKYGNYTASELQAYEIFLMRSTSLILISEYLRYGRIDDLAEMIGISFAGIAFGNVSRFADHPITNGATPFYFNAGAVVIDTTSNSSIEFLGWLSEDAWVDLNDNGIHDEGEPTGMPVMGILHHPNSKIFFLGEINGIETVPQPFVSNLIDWTF